jgi:hypothetical protein
MSEGDWGSWESSAEHTYTKGLSVTADERLAWVEEMLELALASGAIPKPRDAWGQPLATSPRDTPRGSPRSA